MKPQPPNAAVAGQPMWLAALAYAALATALICFPAWPGHMNYDGLYAYERSFLGVEHMTWPPTHTYLFWLSRKAGLGVGGLFVAQTFLLFLGAGLSATLLIRSRAWAMAAMAAFAAAFVAVPPMLGVAMAHWRDVTVGSFALLSLGLWLLAARHRQPLLLIGAALALGLSVSLRYNAFPLFALIAPLMVWRPYLAPRAGVGLRVFAALALVAGVGLAWASWQWRLPDFKRMPAAGTLYQIQLFDLLGVSACADRNFLPPLVTGGHPITPAQIREAYDPRHVQMAHEPQPGGGPPILKTAGGGTVGKAWREVIPKHLGCYLDHRRIVMVEQLGMAKGGVFYPVHGGIDANARGLALSHPGLSLKVSAYVQRNAPEAWRRPALLYALALVVVGLLAVRRDPRTILLLALAGGALANLALLFVIGPAADARYIFPSNAMCALVIAVGVALLFEGLGGRKPRR